MHTIIIVYDTYLSTDAINNMGISYNNLAAIY